MDIVIKSCDFSKQVVSIQFHLGTPFFLWVSTTFATFKCLNRKTLKTKKTEFFPTSLHVLLLISVGVCSPHKGNFHLTLHPAGDLPLSVIILFKQTWKPHIPADEVLMFTIRLYYFKTQLMCHCKSSFPRRSLKLQLDGTQHTILYIKFNQLPAAVCDVTFVWATSKENEADCCCSKFAVPL